MIQFLHSIRHGPLAIHCMHGAPVEVIGKMLELRADPNGGKGGAGSVPALGVLASTALTGPNVLRSAQMLLDYRADVNQRGQPQDIYRLFELVCRACGCCRCRTPAVVKLISNVASTTSLGSCACFDHVELASFLLHARADPEIRNNRGLRPVDFAISEEMQKVLSAPPE